LTPDVVVIALTDVNAIAAALRRYEASGRTVVTTHYDDGKYSVQSRAGPER